MRKVIALALCVVFLCLLAACAAGEFDYDTQVYPITREEGSGTRSAFAELAGLEKKDDNGNKLDTISSEAAVTNSTSVVIIGVSSNEYAIGYISLGSLSDMVKALSIDGVFPSADTVASGEYKISRPFTLACVEVVSAAAQDFLDFVLSAQGQRVVASAGYIPVAGTKEYMAGGFTERVVIAGSSSITPVMEKLKEEYLKYNPGAHIDVQQSDSTTGVMSLQQGICDLAMVSRSLKTSELQSGLLPVTIAKDGIVIIVSPDNPLNALTSAQLQLIYSSDYITWSELLGGVNE